MSTRLVLVRHGESQCTRAQVVGGPSGCTGLSELGREQVGRLARRLSHTGELDRVTGVFSSTLPRAIETAELLSKVLANQDIETDCDLCELHPGEADGMTWDELNTRFGRADFIAEPHRPLAPGAESWAGFVSRITGALTRLAESHPGESLLISSHGGVVEATMVAFLGLADYGRNLRLHTKNASLTEWEHAEGTWRLLRYNDAAHLEGPTDSSGDGWLNRRD